ncbi:Zinc/iron permease [Cynara cardunculus var. scolymus]|uniref:Zinc/iron permease n=1 Tax=Cynara cardunculus var. scolymus TaxID=59895 RepID=A0A103XUE5_CYNCS|nr:Zinc/iron permease [Cynara cardunculus var. scolymus]
MLMGVFFALTTPSGIVIGILVSNSYEENSPTALIVQGVLNAASAGILIYMALVDLLSPDFKDPRMQKNKILLLTSNVSLLLGAGLIYVKEWKTKGEAEGRGQRRLAIVRQRV